MISKFSLPCDAANACKVTSDQMERGTFNNTEFAFQKAQIRLCLADKNCYELLVLTTDLLIHVMGVNSQAHWAHTMGGLLQIDLFTGKTVQTAREHHLAVPLPINNADWSFYLPSFYTIQADLFDFKPAFSNFKVNLQFPRPDSPHNGEYFFLMNAANLVGWDRFLREMLGGFNHKIPRYTLEFQGPIINLDHRLFPSYDMQPFKLAPETDPMAQYTMGRFFIAKTEMVLFLRPSDRGGLAASAQLTDGNLWYGLTLNPISCVQAAILFSLILCGFGLVLRGVRQCTAPKDEEDYAHI